MITSEVHRSFAHPVDNFLGLWIPVDEGAFKSRSAQGNRVNQLPATYPVPGSETPFIDTVRNSPITVRKA